MHTARIEPLWMLAATPQIRPIDILVPLGWLTLATVAIIVIAFFIRKKLRDGGDEPVNTMAFSLSELRRLKAEGQISDAEFERTKAALIARSRAAMDRGAADQKMFGGDHDEPPNHPPPTDIDSDNQNNSLNGPQ